MEVPGQENHGAIRILVAESHDLTRLGLCALIEAQPSLRLVGTTDCFDKLLDLARLIPNVILLDVSLKDGRCTNFLPQLLQLCPECRILAFAHEKDEQTQLRLFNSGAAGIMSRNQGSELLLKAIHAVHAGEVWFDRQLIKLLWRDASLPESSPSSARTPAQPVVLSARECSVAYLACKGLSAPKIADRLALSEKTVRNQLTVVYEKFHVSNQVELCLKAAQVDFCKQPLEDRDNCPYLAPNKTANRDNSPCCPRWRHGMICPSIPQGTS